MGEDTHNHSYYIPRKNQFTDIANLNLSKDEGYILACIDGQTTMASLAQIHGISQEAMDAKLERLAIVGAIIYGQEFDDDDFNDELDEALFNDIIIYPYELAEEVDLSRSHMKRIIALHRKLESIDYYRLLGLDKKASQPMVEQAYRKALKRYYPAHFAGRNLGSFQRKMRDITEGMKRAYYTLRDERLRSVYNQRIGLEETVFEEESPQISQESYPTVPPAPYPGRVVPDRQVGGRTYDSVMKPEATAAPAGTGEPGLYDSVLIPEEPQQAPSAASPGQWRPSTPAPAAPAPMQNRPDFGAESIDDISWLNETSEASMGVMSYPDQEGGGTDIESVLQQMEAVISGESDNLSEAPQPKRASPKPEERHSMASNLFEKALADQTDNSPVKKSPAKSTPSRMAPSRSGLSVQNLFDEALSKGGSPAQLKKEPIRQMPRKQSGPSASQIYNNAIFNESSGQYAPALQMYLKAITIEPDKLDYYSRAVKLMLDLDQDLGKARQLATEGMRLAQKAKGLEQSSAVEMYRSMGRLHEKSNNYKAALKEYRRAYKLDSSNLWLKERIKAVKKKI